MKNIVIALKGRRNFGDLVCYLPLIMKLKAQNSGCKVTILGHFPQCKLLCFPGAADEFIDYSTITTLQLIKLVKGNFDFFINFNSSSFKMKCLGFLFFKNKEKVSIKLEEIKNTYTAYKVLSAIGWEEKDTTIISNLSSNKTKDSSYLSLLPGGGGTTGSGTFKRWDLKNFISTAECIIEKDRGFSKVVFILGNNEKEYLDLIPEEINGIPVSIALNYSIPDLIDVAINSRLAISNDCGPSHIFHMLEKNMVTLFGVSNKNNSPYDVIKSWYLERENACSLVVPYNRRDINAISTDKCAKLALSLI